MSGDHPSYITRNNNHNLFGYCSNLPTNNYDPKGTAILTISTVATIAIKWLLIGFGAFITTKIASDPNFQDALDDAIGVLGKRITVPSKALSSAIDAAVSIALLKAKNPKFEKHHIVAKADRRAKKSRDLLSHEDVNINVNDNINLVYIAFNLHKHIHSTPYHDAVYECLKLAEGSYKKTVAVLILIKAALSTASALCQ